MNEQTVQVQEELQQEQTDFKAAWARFVENQVADFFTGYKLEKLTCEDGNGNKAKLTKTKDCGIKVEYTSTVNI